MNEDKINQIKSYVEKYKKDYDLFHDAICLPLTFLQKSATMPIAILLKGIRRSLVIYSYGATNAIHQPKWLPVIFLDNDKNYLVDEKNIYSGVELNNAGLTIPPVMGDFKVNTYLLEIK